MKQLCDPKSFRHRLRDKGQQGFFRRTSSKQSSSSLETGRWHEDGILRKKYHLDLCKGTASSVPQSAGFDR